jgi:hypothetical protein
MAARGGHWPQEGSRNKAGMCPEINRINSSPLYQGFEVCGTGSCALHGGVCAGRSRQGGHGKSTSYDFKKMHFSIPTTMRSSWSLPLQSGCPLQPGNHNRLWSETMGSGPLMTASECLATPQLLAAALGTNPLALADGLTIGCSILGQTRPRKLDKKYFFD